MKTKLLLIGNLVAGFLAVSAGVDQAFAQGTRFVRIAGPTATKITAFRADGTLVWTNALVGTNYTIQTVSSLPGGSNWVDYVRIFATNNINTNQLIDFNPPAGMALIPAGSFTMGDNLDGDITEASPTNVNVSAFYLDVNLVSYSQWQSVYNWATTNGYGFVYAGSGKATNHPVQTVDWYDVVKWCNARSQQSGLTPVYYTAGLTQVFTNGETTNVFANWAATGYRLPTEAEWEKAARGGLTGKRFPWGDTISETNANYIGCTNLCGFGYDSGPDGYNVIGSIGGTSPATSPVGSFAANGYGLYDMAGNVSEWCWDWYGTYAGGSDPRGAASGTERVYRGGSWSANASPARCAYRRKLTPPGADLSIGFRCARGR